MEVEIKGSKVRLPDFLIVGAGKSGTTSLYYNLKQHPQIFMPANKEPHFFSHSGKSFLLSQESRISAPERIWSFADYVGLFNRAEDEQVLGEASTSYLIQHEESIINMKRYIPTWQKVKIIIILRNPVDRAFSHYMMYKLWGVESLEFEDAIRKHTDPKGNKTRLSRYIVPGYYHKQVKAYLDNFPHVKVCLLDDLRADALGLVRDLYRFLRVDDSFVPKAKRQYYPTGAPWSKFLHRFLSTPAISRIPLLRLIPIEKRIYVTGKLLRLNIKERVRMKGETRRYLKDLYREDVLKLQDLMGRDLSGWMQ